ncbi:MAG TPA: hypothetical protein VMZ53_03590 [Kofleriaceae bacterium]|nr:hypothetical protein [Kofleriaceae bacterium]
METHDDSTEHEYDSAPRGNQLARRDFSGSSLSVASAATDALVAKERANVEARWIMAMRRPRNMDDVRQLMLKECRRPGFADAAVYEIPRGGTKITGLSIRFAEVAVRCMGNLQPEVVTIHDDDDTRIVKCSITDYESNITWSRDISIRKTVERKQLARGQRPLGERTNSYGDRVFIVPGTDDDVATKEAAIVSKTLRTLILRCIPGHLQDECLALCNKIYADKAAKDPDAERVKVLDAFAGIGVLPSEIEELIGHTTERMSPAEVDRLRKLFSAINEGHASIAEAIDAARADRAKAPKAAPAQTATPGDEGGKQPTSAQAAPQATNAAPAQQPATAQPAAPASAGQAKASKSGKGTAGLKNALGGNPDSSFAQAAEQARAKDAAREAKADPEAEPGWMSGKADDASEERPCAGCGVPIDAKKSDPPGGKCYACLNA